MSETDHMDTRDVWLLHLYDGRQVHEGRQGDASPELYDASEEAESMREMKALLDARAKQTPEPRTVGAVLSAARTAPRGTRQDRSPVRRARTVGLRVGAASALVVLLIGLVGILQVDVMSPGAEPDSLSSSSSAVGEAPSAFPQTRSPMSAEATESGPVPAAADPSIVRPSVAGFGATDSYEVMSWDDRADVIELYQRIEMIGSGVDSEWEVPPVPLEMLPTKQGGGGIIPAGSRR